MKSAKVNIGDNGLASQYNNLRDDAFASAHLLPHEQTTPDLTLKVESGVAFIGVTKVVFAGGNSPSFTAPTTNPRIDLLTIDSAGVLARVVGTEAASPSVPAYPADKIVLCEVFNRVGQTTIRDTDTAGQGYIQRDVRPFLGGTFISSDDQVAAGANIKASKLDSGNVDADLLPDADNTRDLGSATRQWAEVRSVKFFKNGSELNPLPPDRQTFNSSGTWTKPTGAKVVLVQLWGAGGSGGEAGDTSVQRAAGGGGGGYTEHWFDAVDLGATESVTIGAGGAAATNSTGNAGGNTTFGTKLTAYGGGGGGMDNSDGAIGSPGGGGGGGSLGAGGNGASNSDGSAGSPGSPLTGAGSGASAHLGAGGGRWNTTGGSAFLGGAGGGGAERSGNSKTAGGTSKLGGNGGSGEGAVNGTAGSQPGGGGGGHVSWSTGGGGTTSGAGGAGRAIITTFF